MAQDWGAAFWRSYDSGANARYRRNADERAAAAEGRAAELHGHKLQDRERVEADRTAKVAGVSDFYKYMDADRQKEEAVQAEKLAADAGGPPATSVITKEGTVLPSTGAWQAHQELLIEQARQRGWTDAQIATYRKALQTSVATRKIELMAEAASHWSSGDLPAAARKLQEVYSFIPNHSGIQFRIKGGRMFATFTDEQSGQPLEGTEIEITPERIHAMSKSMAAEAASAGFATHKDYKDTRDKKAIESGKVAQRRAAAASKKITDAEKEMLKLSKDDGDLSGVGGSHSSRMGPGMDIFRSTTAAGGYIGIAEAYEQGKELDKLADGLEPSARDAETNSALMKALERYVTVDIRTGDVYYTFGRNMDKRRRGRRDQPIDITDTALGQKVKKLYGKAYHSNQNIQKLEKKEADIRGR